MKEMRRCGLLALVGSPAAVLGSPWHHGDERIAVRDLLSDLLLGSAPSPTDDAPKIDISNTSQTTPTAEPSLESYGFNFSPCPVTYVPLQLECKGALYYASQLPKVVYTTVTEVHTMGSLASAPVGPATLITPPPPCSTYSCPPLYFKMGLVPEMAPLVSTVSVTKKTTIQGTPSQEPPPTFRESPVGQNSPSPGSSIDSQGSQSTGGGAGSTTANPGPITSGPSPSQMPVPTRTMLDLGGVPITVQETNTITFGNGPSRTTVTITTTTPTTFAVDGHTFTVNPSEVIYHDTTFRLGPHATASPPLASGSGNPSEIHTDSAGNTILPRPTGTTGGSSPNRSLAVRKCDSLDIWSILGVIATVCLGGVVGLL